MNKDTYDLLIYEYNSIKRTLLDGQSGLVGNLWYTNNSTYHECMERSDCKLVFLACVYVIQKLHLRKSIIDIAIFVDDDVFEIDMELYFCDENYKFQIDSNTSDDELLYNTMRMLYIPILKQSGYNNISLYASRCRDLSALEWRCKQLHTAD